jgi:hypothetical protein
MIERGRIKVYRMPGAGFGTNRFDADELRRVLNTERDVTFMDGLLPENASYEASVRALNRMAGRLAQKHGAEPIHKLLAGFGVERIGDLHPDCFAKFKARLLVLARSDRKPYARAG